MLKNCLKNIYLGQCCGQKLGVGERVSLIWYVPPQNRPTIDRYIDRQIGRHYYSKQDLTFLGESQKAGKPRGGTLHMKGVGMLVGNFALNP